MKKLGLLFVLVGFVFSAFSQKYITKSGKIDILSKSTFLTIDGKNKKVACILDTKTGDIVASTLILSFEFKEALLQEHFNENYMESKKFPKSTFSGKISDLTKVDFTKNGTYNVKYEGKLTMHGVTNPISYPAIIVVSAKGINVKTDFKVSLAGYKIKVEQSYKDRINDDIQLKIDFNLEEKK